MKKLRDEELKEKYIKENKLNEIFTEDLEKEMELLFYKKGEYMCRQGEDIEYLLFFVKGKAKVSINLLNGKSLLICFYYPFMVLGDLELATLNKASTDTQIMEDTYCIGLSLSKVRKRLLKDAKFLGYISKSLGDKLERASKNGSINLLYPLENRLASYIIATREEEEENTYIFKENLTEVAELLGTSYRHLMRTINGLCEKGIMTKMERGSYAIDDEELKILGEEIYR